MFTTEAEALDAFNEFLDSSYSGFSFGDVEYVPSRVLKMVDPIAYRCGFLDYCDAFDIDLDEME